jgi:hypothetical protein
MLLLVVFLAAACNGSTPQGALTVGPLTPSKNERGYFGKFHTSPAHATPAHGTVAVQRMKRLRSAAVVGGAEVVSLRVYDLSARARQTPVMTIAVRQPAQFLSRYLNELLDAVNPGPYYLRIVDGNGRPILEIWAPGPGHGGYAVARKYAGCSLVTQDGLGIPPPCPSH